jgi:hypothetical protein
MYRLKSADIDINPAELSVYWGGNGDIYVTIYDESGIHGVRLCTSGGPEKEQPIRIAMAQVAREFFKLDPEE